jgi:large subunit ribosomal protein L17
MRHKKLNKRLGRNKSNRKQLLRSIVRALFLSHKIETTLAKAKEARKLADRLIKHAKSGSLKGIREIESIIQDRALTSKIVKVLAPLSKDRKGGYTRITKIGFRRGDSAQLAILELTDAPVKEEKQKKSKKEKTKIPDDKKQHKPESGKAEQEKYQDAEKPKKDGAQKKEQAPVKSKKPRPDKKQVDRKKEEPKPKVDKKPEKEKSRPDKRGLFGKFKGFFKQQ